MIRVARRGPLKSAEGSSCKIRISLAESIGWYLKGAIVVLFLAWADERDLECASVTSRMHSRDGEKVVARADNFTCRVVRNAG